MSGPPRTRIRPGRGLDRFTPEQTARGLAGMLVTIGILHFVVPKPFDEIIPEEIPADPRTLTRVGCRRGRHRFRPPGTGDPQTGGRAGRGAVHRGVSGEHQHGAAVVAQTVALQGDRPCPAPLPVPDDRRGAQGGAGLNTAVRAPCGLTVGSGSARGSLMRVARSRNSMRCGPSRRRGRRGTGPAESRRRVYPSPAASSRRPSG